MTSARPGSLGDRLRGARRGRLVGRTGEVEVFRSALLVAEDPATVLFLHGPGGVGKTSLLELMAEVAVADGATPVRLDARFVPASPDGLLAALGTTLDTPADPLAALARVRRPVLMIDTYELLAPLDEWVREEFLPALPGDALVVIAGRHPPAPRWSADPAWRELLRVVSVRNLAPRDGRAYLAAQGVPASVQDRLIALSHGHPLTLSLLVDAVHRRRSDAGNAAPTSLADVPDLVRVLLTHVVDEAPTARHRAALEVCAHAHTTTEHLVRSVLGSGGDDGHDDAGELFAWLRTLSFVQEGPHGLVPHDVARDALDADLRWRDRDRYAELHHRVRTHLLGRIRAADDEREQQRLLADAIFVARTHPALAAYVAGVGSTDAFIDELRPSDRPAVVEMTAALQGPEQAALVDRWMRCQPSGFRVFRGHGGVPQGYGGYIALHEVDAADIAADPGAAAMWAYAQRHGPPRAGEQVMAWRFFLDRTHHHGPSASLTLVTVWHVLDLLVRDRVAWGFLGTYSDVERWGPVMTYMDYARAAEADYEVDGTRYAVFAHDWRRTGLAEWLALTEARELGATTRPPQEHPPELVLSQPEFADAVRAALRDLHAPDRLARNPLVRSQVVRRHRAGRPEPETLRALLTEAAATLRATGRDDLPYQVVDRTFLRPAATQERAAAALHLSFSTYRRHRDRAVARIVEWMWEREVYGGP